MTTLSLIPLIQAEYKNYGDVISIRDDINPVGANIGTAKRYNYLTHVKNLRADATLNVCVFNCTPQIKVGQKEFLITLLEKHSESTQIFIPMNGTKKYLVAVALGQNAPDISTLKVFLASGDQGITYHPGVWHHPLIAMDEVSNFSCLVYENQTASDNFVKKLDNPIKITL